MSRRVLLTSALVALLLGTIFLGPGVPVVRDALLTRALRMVEDAGFQVTYQRSEGNAWRRVELRDVTVTGQGADVDLHRLELRYHLPSLLGGELPISVAAQGVTGNVDLSGLEALVEDAVDDGGGVGLPVRVVLREVDLQDVQLSSANAPFELPDATLSDLSVVPDQGALVLGATIATQHGSVSARGRLTVPGFELTGEVVEGDVGVARSWWEGATHGTFRGPFSYRRGQLNADLRISDARIDQAGVAVTDIGGTAVLRYPVITASLAGRSLDGPVSAEGTVNIAARNYRATGRATPSLGAAAGLLADLADLDDTALAASGQANVTAEISGWQQPTLRVGVTGSGQLAGLPLRDLDASLNLQVKGPLRANLDAAVAGGSL